MKKKLIAIVVVVLVIVLAIVGVFFYRQRLNNNPRYVFEKFFDEITNTEVIAADTFSNVFENIIEKENSPHRVNLDGSIKVECLGYCNKEAREMLEKINNMKINTTLDYDLSKLLANLDYKINYDNKDLINGTANYKDDYLYLTFSSNGGNESIRLSEALEILADAFELDDENIEENLKDNLEAGKKEISNIKNVSKQIKQFNEKMKKNLKDEYFSKSDEVIDVNGESIKVKKYSLTMSSDEMEDFVDSMGGVVDSEDRYVVIFNILNDFLAPGYIDMFNMSDSDSNYDNYGYNLNIFINPKNNSIEKIEMKRYESLLTLERKNDDFFEICADEDVVGEVKINNGIDFHIYENKINVYERIDEAYITINKEQVSFKDDDIELTISGMNQDKKEISFKHKDVVITGTYENDKAHFYITFPKYEIGDNLFDINFEVDLNISSIKEVKEISIKDYKTCSYYYESYCTSEEFFENVSDIFSVLPFEFS